MAVDGSCEVNGTEDCTACNTGYTLNGQVCRGMLYRFHILTHTHTHTHPHKFMHSNTDTLLGTPGTPHRHPSYHTSVQR